MRGWVPVLLALCTAAAYPPHAGAQVSDRSLSERVADAVFTYTQYGVFDSIDVEVQDRAVTLSGRVTDSRKKDEIEKRVQKVDGVRSLTNDIGVLAPSPADDELRYRIARSIYNHPMFWIHGQRPVPPIHIIVEQGRVTLTGLADSEDQRTMAASLAEVTGSSGVTNRIRVGKR